MYQYPDLFETLRSIPWFVELTPSQLKKLTGIVTIHQIGAGQHLFCENDREDSLYILLEGQIELRMRIPGHGERTIFTAEPLDIVGWSSMTQQIVRERTATAIAIQPTTLLEFNGTALRQLCDQDHDLGYVVMRRIANVVASRLLTIRLSLLEAIVQRDALRHPVTME